jgi:hypothetical protein
MRSLVVILLVAAGCGIPSYDSFRDQLATRWCARQIRCGEVGASESQTRCSLPAPLALTMRGAVDIPTAISSHRMIFHPDNAAQCLDTVKHAPCDAAQAADDFLRHCNGVVTAGIATGKSCWGDDECVGGRCVGGDCGGTCVAYAVPGGPCVPSGGPPDMTCDPSVHFCGDDGTCQHKVNKGKPCSADEQCLFDYVCVAGKCADSARVARDDVCGTMLPPCKDGLYCDETGACEPLLSEGQSCVRPDACQSGLVCAGGTCVRWLDAGGACVSGGGTLASGCPATQTCSAGACAPVADVKGGPLAQCSADGDCADGLYCGANGYCSYPGGISAPCDSDRSCAAELKCLSGACHPAGYGMCATN